MSHDDPRSRTARERGNALLGCFYGVLFLALVALVASGLVYLLWRWLV